MFLPKFFVSVTLAIIWILLLSCPIWAAQSDIYSLTEPGEEPSQYQIELLFNQIAFYNPSLSNEQKSTVCNTILNESKKCGFDPLFIASIIAAESSFHPYAVSPCEAFGLMQLTACVSKAMHIKNPFNIQENIYAGTRFLKYLRTRFTENNLILAAYNAGPTRVARLGRIPRIKETLCYIKRVNSIYNALQKDFFSLLKSAIAKPIICLTIRAITHPNSPKNQAQLYSSDNPESPFLLNPFVCAEYRSFRWVIPA